MENRVFAEELDDELGAINWDDLFDELPSPNDLLPPQSHFSNSSPETASSWIGEIENLLMNDDADKVDDVAADFMADILVDSPVQGSSVDLKEKEEGTNKEDLMSKKLKRQLRNRDAAMKSRERKKMYVKDLEMKSKYLEGECRRLGRLLQCLASENHALRQAHSAAFGATTTKQESAVLFLESLLLGSLLWFLGTICLFPQIPRSTLVEIPIESGEEMAPQKLVPRGARSNMLVSSRRCKASRTRMKPRFIPGVRVLTYL